MFTHKTNPEFSHTARFKGLFQEFFRLSLIFFLLILTVRAFGIIYNGIIHGFSAAAPGQMILSSVVHDLVFFLKTDFWLFWVFLILYYFSKKTARIVYAVIASLLVLIQLGLVFYFLTALVPLGADLFEYSKAEIQQTVGAAGSLNIVSILAFVILIALCFLIFRFLFRKIHLPVYVVAAWPVIIFIIWLLPKDKILGKSHFQNDFINNLVLNKTAFFVRSTERHFFPADDDVDIYADSFIGLNNSNTEGIRTFTYVNVSQYPFLHKRDTLDVLSPFFRKDSVKPNIVILLVEGLGRAFTNEGAYLGNFTPFLDSLAGESLYWNNFLSEGGRTFAVLPSVLGSLPFGKNGFCEMAGKMPHQLSLMSLLKTNGYRTSFFYGGNAHFDYMDIFLKKQGIDAIYDIDTFGPKYDKMPESSSGFSWGYGDKELFRYYFNTLTQHPPQPRLNVLLTLSTHSPFLIYNEDYYLQRFEKRMDELHFTEKEKEQHCNYKMQYATILFMDDAVKWFFNEYEKRSEFKNTIFLITGDHRMPEIPMSTKIDRYHVPLIIYSPLLKRTANFQSISTHFDITPSLLAFMKNQYDIKIPSVACWMGSGLDTARNFRNIHAYPLMQTKSAIIDFIMGDWMLHNQDLYHITSYMGLKPASNPKKKAELTAAFNRFQEKNDRFIQGAPLIPDSVYQQFYPR